MKLKEIKPGMVVHCKNDEEKKLLLGEAERLGYVLYSTKERPTERSVHDIENTIHFYDAGTNGFSADYKHITHSCQICNTEFSDLIIPDMSAEEVLSILHEIRSCSGRDCNQCPISDKNNGNYGYCSDNYGVRVSNNSGILEICQKWKLDHEKKEPEIEWVYRVYNGESEKFVDSEEKAISECELSTKGNQKKYAFYQKVCRVKAVE